MLEKVTEQQSLKVLAAVGCKWKRPCGLRVNVSSNLRELFFCCVV